MKYPRYSYGDPSVKMRRAIMPIHTVYAEYPDFAVPITALENFTRAITRENPLWVPNSFSDMQTIIAQYLVTEEVRGTRINADFQNHAPGDYTFIDWFNTSWTWIHSAGGAMLTPGTRLLESITDWERDVVWPDLSEWDFEETAARFMRNEYIPGKVLNIDVGRGCTERLISLVGGYTEGMLAFATEPEAAGAFCECYAEHIIALLDKVFELYPVNMITYHDDWGTELDTFFSEKMMEDIVFGPTKRIIDHVKSKGVFFMLHSCGNITRFMPYILDFNVDLLQIQRRAVNIPELKRKYGDRVGFNAGLEGADLGAKLSNERLTDLIRNTVDLYAPGGGFLATFFSADPEQLWHLLDELYAYSREFYDNERGRT